MQAQGARDVVELLEIATIGSPWLGSRRPGDAQDAAELASGGEDPRGETPYAPWIRATISGEAGAG